MQSNAYPVLTAVDQADIISCKRCKKVREARLSPVITNIETQHISSQGKNTSIASISHVFRKTKNRKGTLDNYAAAMPTATWCISLACTFLFYSLHATHNKGSVWGTYKLWQTCIINMMTNLAYIAHCVYLKTTIYNRCQNLKKKKKEKNGRFIRE